MIVIYLLNITEKYIDKELSRKGKNYYINYLHNIKLLFSKFKSMLNIIFIQINEF